MEPPEIPAVLSTVDPPTRACCDRTPTPEMLHAFEQFNRGEYWHQHETLELVWRAEQDTTIRNFYKGILQIGVGFHHLRNGNYNGVLKVLGRGINYVKPYSPECYGVDLARLIQEASVVYWRVREAGKEGIGEIKGMELPKVHLAAADRAREVRMEYQTVQAARVGESYRKMTFEEYVSLDDQGRQTEWVDGEVRAYVPYAIQHQEIINFLDRLLGIFVEMMGLGVVLTDRIAMRIKPNVAREPDLLFVTNEHRDRLKRTYLDGAADLVVEVLSEESIARDRVDKFYEYQDAGVREYLLIDPRIGKPRVDYYWLDSQGNYQAIVADSEGRFYSRVIPGFWFREEWLLGEKQPDPIVTLGEIRGLSGTDIELLRQMLTRPNTSK